MTPISENTNNPPQQLNAKPTKTKKPKKTANPTKSRNREKLYITISPHIKEKAGVLANSFGISRSRLIEHSLTYYMEKYGIHLNPTAEDIGREIAKLDKAPLGQ